MAEGKRLSKLAGELGVGVNTLVDFLQKKGYTDYNPNTKVNEDVITLLEREYSKDKSIKEASDQKIVEMKNKPRKSSVSIESSNDTIDKEVLAEPLKSPKVVGKIDLDSLNKPKHSGPKKEQQNQQPRVKEVESAPVEEKKKEPQATVDKPSVEENKDMQSESSDVFRISDSPKISGPNVVGKKNLQVEKSEDHKRNKRKKHQRISGG